MENKEKNFMSAVIYVHNAEDRIEGFLEMVVRTLEKILSTRKLSASMIARRITALKKSGRQQRRQKRPVLLSLI